MGLNQDGFVLARCQKWDLNPALLRKTRFPNVQCSLINWYSGAKSCHHSLSYVFEAESFIKKKIDLCVYFQATAVMSSGAMEEKQMFSK